MSLYRGIQARSFAVGNARILGGIKENQIGIRIRIITANTTGKMAGIIRISIHMDLKKEIALAFWIRSMNLSIKEEV